MLFLGVKGQEKRPEILEISGLGGDKRDRTADLLNAIYNTPIFYRLISF